MEHDPHEHRRRSIRLRDYDYSTAGAYFVTICAHNRDCILGEIVGREVRLQEPGIMVRDTWELLEQRFSNMKIDAHVVMPNHIHGIIGLVRRAPRGRP